MKEENTNTVQFELVSPEERLMDEPAVMVVVPGEEGDIGVLREHSPLLTTIRPGVVNIYKQNMDTVTDQIFLAGGFADVTAERVTILAEEAIAVAKIDKKFVENQLEIFRKDIDLATSDAEKRLYERRIDVAEAKLDAVAHVA